MSTCLKCLKSFLPLDLPVYGLHRGCFLRWFHLKEQLEFTNLSRKSVHQESSEKVGNTNDDSSFFLGKFRKYSADLGRHSYILKVKEAEAPELPNVEYLSNQIGTCLRIPVPEYYLIEYFGERTFVVKNFISKRSSINLTHIHHYYRGSGPIDCEGLIRIISQETRQYSDIETFIRVCLFDALIGNHDRHGRNLGLLVTSKGSSLAPIYDNPSALGLESGGWLKADFNPTGRIPTHASTEPSARDYVVEFNRLGYREIVKIFSEQIDLKKIINAIDQSFCSPLMKEAFKKLVEKRAREIQNELQKGS